MNRLDETNVCYLCETTQDCGEGNEVEALSGEWVCLSCQDKLVSELAPKIKADAVREAIAECRYNGADGQGWESDLEQYANKLEGGE